jgi:SET domain-containing protein
MKHELQRNQESHLYIMHLVGSLHIASLTNDNATRFSNHSCDPNAQITLITVSLLLIYFTLIFFV